MTDAILTVSAAPTCPPQRAPEEGGSGEGGREPEFPDTRQPITGIFCVTREDTTLRQSRNPPAAARFKGAVLKEISPWLFRTFGASAVHQAFDSLPAELSRGLNFSAPHFGALTSAWYDALTYHHMLDALLALQPDVNRTNLARDAARTVLNQTLRGIYGKLFGLMATPPLYARYVQKLWDMHYDTGTVTIVHKAPNFTAHTVEGWAGHHPFVCEMNRQSGAIVYAMMGLKNVRIQQQRCATPRCEAVYLWDL